MRWEDEPWVKVYTTDTGDWLALGWEAQALFLFALRKADRAGIVRTGKNVARGLAGMSGMPVEIVERALPLLLDDGCMRACEGGLVIPNFVAAQEARTSDAQRKREQRARDRDRAIAGGMHEATSRMVIESLAARERDVTKRDSDRDIGHAMSSQNVTKRHTESHGVTSSHTASRLEEKRLDETRVEDLFPAVASAPQASKATRKSKASPDKPTDPRHAPLVKALVEGQGWELGRGRGAKAVTALLAAADEAPATRGEAAPAEVLRRAANALEKRRVAPTAFPAVAALWELAQHWAHFATAPGRATGPPVAQAHVGGHDDSHRECAGCGAEGSGGRVGEPGIWLGYGCGCLPDFSQALSDGLHFTEAQEWARKRRAA